MGSKLQRRLARATARAARRATKLDRRQEAQLHDVARRLDEARLLSLDPELYPGSANGAHQPVMAGIWPRRRALLIINSKSGPRRDSLLRLGDIVDLLSGYNFRVEVRIKLHKAQARREARRAAGKGIPIVIAAGGDGTIEAVAAGLVGTRTALGILPLGTFNNVATCLGVPTNLAEACALIANFDPRPIDVGYVEAVGMARPRLFLEMATVGLGALLAPLGQDLEKGRLSDAARTLPMVMNMAPTGMLLHLDDVEPALWGNGLLLTISNTPRAGAALSLAPDARVDDGVLDVVLYDGLTQTDLAARMLAVKAGTHTQDPRLRQTRARSIEVHTNTPMAVAADSRLVGVTPARFTVRGGDLLAIVGRGPGLSRPSTAAVALPELAAAIAEQPPAALPQPDAAALAGRANRRQPPFVREITTPAVAALVGAVAIPFARAVAQRLSHRQGH